MLIKAMQEFVKACRVLGPGSVLAISLVASDGSAQETAGVPVHFQDMRGAAGDLGSVLSQVAERQRRSAPQTRYWAAFRFPVREALLRHNDGRVRITRSGHVNYWSGDGHGWWDDIEAFYEDSTSMRIAALRALAKQGDAKAIAALDSLQPEAEPLDAYAVFFLFSGGAGGVDRVTILPPRFATRMRGEPVYWLGDWPAVESFRFISELAADADQPRRIRRPAMFLLALHDHAPAVDALMRFVEQDKDRDVRREAITWLGRIREPRVLPFLVSTFDREKSGKLQKHLIFAVSQQDTEAAIQQLIRWADTLPAAGLRKQAIFWLGQIAGERTLRALRGIIEDDNTAEVQKQAVFALSQHRDREESTRLLVEIARNHRSPRVRKAAIFWLGQTNETAALTLYRSLLGDAR